MLSKYTNEELTLLLEDRKCVETIKCALGKFSRSLDSHILEDCKINGIIRCIKSYDAAKGTFSTSLYKYITWECQKALKRKNTHRMISYNDVSGRNTDSSLIDFKDTISILSKEDQSILTLRFVYNYTLEEIGQHHDKTREWARIHLKAALKNYERKVLSGV